MYLGKRIKPKKVRWKSRRSSYSVLNIIPTHSNNQIIFPRSGWCTEKPTHKKYFFSSMIPDNSLQSGLSTLILSSLIAIACHTLASSIGALPSRSGTITNIPSENRTSAFLDQVLFTARPCSDSEKGGLWFLETIKTQALRLCLLESPNWSWRRTFILLKGSLVAQVRAQILNTGLRSGPVL